MLFMFDPVALSHPEATGAERLCCNLETWARRRCEANAAINSVYNLTEAITETPSHSIHARSL